MNLIITRSWSTDVHNAHRVFSPAFISLLCHGKEMDFFTYPSSLEVHSHRFDGAKNNNNSIVVPLKMSKDKPPIIITLAHLLTHNYLHHYDNTQ